MNISVQMLDTELPKPQRAHGSDAGLDLTSVDSFTLEAGERRSVGTGIAVAIPEGHAGLVLARSGLAAKHGIGIVNSPGLIDSGYRGEIRVLLINHGDTPVTISRGDRIAQLVVSSVVLVNVEIVDQLDSTQRGVSGFGSSGV